MIMGKKRMQNYFKHYPEWPVYYLRLKDSDGPYGFESVLERDE